MVCTVATLSCLVAERRAGTKLVYICKTNKLTNKQTNKQTNYDE